MGEISLKKETVSLGTLSSSLLQSKFALENEAYWSTTERRTAYLRGRGSSS